MWKARGSLSLKRISTRKEEDGVGKKSQEGRFSNCMFYSSMSVDPPLMDLMSGGEDGIARIKDLGGVHAPPDQALARRWCDILGGNHW